MLLIYLTVHLQVIIGLLFSFSLTLTGSWFMCAFLDWQMFFFFVAFVHIYRPIYCYSPNNFTTTNDDLIIIILTLYLLKC